MIYTAVRSDADLVAAWRAGDKAAGEELVARHWTSIAGFFRNKVGDDGADLISQTFLACLEADGPIDNVKAFLFAVARRRIADHFRARARTPELDLARSSLIDLATGPVTAAARRQQNALLREGLARIPLDDQIALELAYFEGLATNDLARVLDVPENTVRSRLSRARDKLRDALQTLCSADEVARELARMQDRK
jgi:RNA polymerase sigma-70 factor (ECF subfamily)